MRVQALRGCEYAEPASAATWERILVIIFPCAPRSDEACKNFATICDKFDEAPTHRATIFQS